MKKFQLNYPDSEDQKREAIDALLDDWNVQFTNQGKERFGECFGAIVRDGFYPHYFSQQSKILFIGKEALGIDGCSYLEVLGESYRETKEVGGIPLNRAFFHARMLHISYGILNGFTDWDNIPWAAKIGDTFATSEGISFAFMNLSKVSNESDSWQADWSLINKACETSLMGRNFPKEQIEILEPDVIITMNIAEKIREIFPEIQEFCKNGNATGYSIQIRGVKTLLIDTYHFSSRGQHVAKFYAPVCDVIHQWRNFEDSLRV